MCIFNKKMVKENTKKKYIYNFNYDSGSSHLNYSDMRRVYARAHTVTSLGEKLTWNLTVLIVKVQDSLIFEFTVYRKKIESILF